MFNIQAQKINPTNLEARFNRITCIYRNETQVIQVIRISQAKTAFFERSLFPNQCVQFFASTDALLEVYESSLCGSIHADTIPCSQIALSEIDMGRDVLVSNELSKSFLVAIAA